MSSPKFPKLPISFHSELKKKIGEYFNQKGRSTTGNFKLHIKAILLVSVLIGLYIHLVFFTPPVVFAIMECVILGCVTAAVGFNVMHDGPPACFRRDTWNNHTA